MARAEKKARSCPVHAFQKLVSGKYKLRIVWDLQSCPRRYGDIRRGLLVGQDGTKEIAARVLSRELKALCDAGILERKDYGELPLRVEYSLTLSGRSLLPVIESMHNWGFKHLV